MGSCLIGSTHAPSTLTKYSSHRHSPTPSLQNKPHTKNHQQVAQYLLSLDKEGRTPDLRWLDEDGCAVVHRVAAAGDVPLLEHLLQVGALYYCLYM